MSVLESGILRFRIERKRERIHVIIPLLFPHLLFIHVKIMILSNRYNDNYFLKSERIQKKFI